MYEMAVPFFPGQEKLQKKIDNLRAKIQAKRNEFGALPTVTVVPEKRRALATAPIVQLPTPATSFEEESKKATPQPRRRKAGADSDDEFNASGMMQADHFEDEDSFAYKSSKAKKSKPKSAAKSALKVFTDDVDTGLEPPTPRTRHLLDVVNSRDVTLIRGLSGVGQKKARDLVEFLELQDDDEAGSIKTLQQLIAVPGLGKRTVERAYEGVTALLV